MLSEIKLVENNAEIKISHDEVDVEDLMVLGNGLHDGCNIINYDYRGKSVVARGIPEDFKILYDGKLVCEFVYDNVYNVNGKLVNELLS